MSIFRFNINLFRAINKKYNDETFFNIEIVLEKTCFAKGEIIKGKIKLIPKDILKKSMLINSTLGNVILEEIHNYKMNQNGANISEENLLFKYPITIPQFDTNSIIQGMEVPFEYSTPLNTYPSCIIDINTYVRHILTFDFPTLEAKKSTLIIVLVGFIHDCSCKI